MINSAKRDEQVVDHSNKSILARGCDPRIAKEAAAAIPPHIGNPKFETTTNDVDFIDQLKSRQWSVVFFAPGACRYNSASLPIPGGINDTRGWTLEQYRELVYKYQGRDVKIVETMDEVNTVGLLKDALEMSKETE